MNGLFKGIAIYTYSYTCHIGSKWS